MKRIATIAVFCLVLAFSFLFSGCAALLPSSKSEIKSPWGTYIDVKNTIKKIVIGVTTTEDLKQMGIDPYTTPNIRILNANDIGKEYLFNNSLKKEDLPEGIQKCLANRDNCQGFTVAPEKIDNKHILKSRWGFFLDWLGFRRVYQTDGWRYKNLVIIVNNVVTFVELDGGNPLIDERKTETKPLGPLQEGDRLIETGREIFK